MTISPPSSKESTRTGQPRPTVEAQGLTLRYGDFVAFEDVSLRLRPGAITALIGPSGCGKTSFLSSINRLTDLIPECSVTGSLRLEEVNVLDSALDVVAHRRRVGMIFQKPNPFPLSIRRNMELALREQGIRGDRLESIVTDSLRRVGLWDEVHDRLDTPALGLSGGQQQRLCLARALALEPEVLLLDEPCSALDPLSSGVVEDLIASLRGRLTVVIVTHNLAQARRIADDVALFWVREGSGRLIEAGPATTLFESPQDPITAAYISGARG